MGKIEILTPPKVSVLLSVHNGARYLREALESILGQTLSNFEFIIIDDGSTDETPRILDEYIDKRIIRIRNLENLGLPQSLNRGLDVAKGEYIARMDADDIALPHRLETQVRYMDAHSDVDFLGTNQRFISGDIANSEGQLYDERDIVSGDFLKWLLIWGNLLAHPTMMMRRQALESHQLRYDPSYASSQDYELWTRAARVCSFAIIPEVCLLYRKHPGSITVTKANLQQDLARKVRIRELAFLRGKEISPEEEGALGLSIGWLEAPIPSNFVAAGRLICEVLRGFLAQNTLSAIDEGRVRTHAAGLLHLIVRRAGSESRKSALRALWLMRGVSMQAFLSVQTVKDVVNVGLLRR